MDMAGDEAERKNTKGRPSGRRRRRPAFTFVKEKWTFRKIFSYTT